MWSNREWKNRFLERCYRGMGMKFGFVVGCIDLIQQLVENENEGPRLQLEPNQQSINLEVMVDSIPI